MWYIYKSNEKVIYSPIEPKNVEYFMIDKLPPIPKDKYMELHADFDEEVVWFERRDLTEEEIMEERINEIDKRLKEIDVLGVNRHFENDVEASKTYDIIYEGTKILIDEKQNLREERKGLINDLKDLRDEDE